MAVIHMLVRGYPLSVWDCDTQDQCARGLLGVIIDDSKGLMLPSGSLGLHTHGMSMPLDVIWYDRNGQAVAVDTNVPSGVNLPSKGEYALELRGGWISRHPRHGQVTGFAGDPNPDVATPDCSCSDLVVRKNVSSGNVDPHERGMHTIQFMGPGPIMRVAGTGQEHGDEFQVGWHTNHTRGLDQWQRGGRGGGWGPPQHDWMWGAQHLVGHFVSGDLDSHLITTPHGAMSQIVGSMVQMTGRTGAGHASAPRGRTQGSQAHPNVRQSQGAHPNVRQSPGAQRGINPGPSQMPGAAHPNVRGASQPASLSGGHGGNPGADFMASMVERPGQFTAGPHGGGGGGGPHGGGGGGGPHGGGHGGHHHGHHDHDHDHNFGFWGGGWGWPWWDWGYACDPRDPNCPNFDPSLDWSWTAQYEQQLH